MILDSTPSGQVRALPQHIGGHVDGLDATAIGFGVAALLAWVSAIIAVMRIGEPRIGALADTLAGTLTVCAMVFAVGGAIRRHSQRLIDQDVSVVCRRLDRIAAELGVTPHGSALPRATVPHSNGAGVSEGLTEYDRGYLSAKMDFPGDN
jgi:hypothetical protein